MTRRGSKRFSVTLDDGVVFAAPERFSAEDERVVYEHAVAPGQHVLGLDIERYDLRGRNFSTWQSSRFSVVVPESKRSRRTSCCRIRSDMAVDFPDDAGRGIRARRAAARAGCAVTSRGRGLGAGCALVVLLASGPGAARRPCDARGRSAAQLRRARRRPGSRTRFRSRRGR